MSGVVVCVGGFELRGHSWPVTDPVGGLFPQTGVVIDFGEVDYVDVVDGEPLAAPDGRRLRLEGRLVAVEF